MCGSVHSNHSRKIIDIKIISHLEFRYCIYECEKMVIVWMSATNSFRGDSTISKILTERRCEMSPSVCPYILSVLGVPLKVFGIHWKWISVLSAFHAVTVFREMFRVYFSFNGTYTENLDFFAVQKSSWLTLWMLGSVSHFPLFWEFFGIIHDKLC